HKQNTALARLAANEADNPALAVRLAALADQLEVLAREAMTNRQFGRARALYPAILNLDPTRQQCQYDFWCCLLGMGEIAAAARIERTLLDKSPELLWKMQGIRDKEAVRLVGLGEELVKAGMDGMAREQFGRAIVLQAGHPVAQFWVQVFDGSGCEPVPRPLMYQAQAVTYGPVFQQTAVRWREAMGMAIDAQQWDNARLFVERIMRLGQATPEDDDFHRQVLDLIAAGGPEPADDDPMANVPPPQPPARPQGPPARPAPKPARDEPEDPDEPETSDGDKTQVIL
ncbi:MAG TPA: hypothetical protein VL860_15475, partial [Planctomycetota bacterium]|nr:hypothetical protein [Planctomycetota bacterium]